MLTYNVFFAALIWYHTYTNTQWQTAHSGTNRLTHPYKYIYIYINTIWYVLPEVMCIALNKWLTDIKSLISTVCFLSKNYSSAKVEYLLIRCSKTEFFLQNTNNADRIDVNIHNTNTKTKHSEKDTASRKRVSMKMGERVGGLTMQWKHHYDLNLLFIYII